MLFRLNKIIHDLKACNQPWMGSEMSKDLLHSFALVAYKKSPYIESCIYSLLEQTQRSNIYISTSTPSIFLNNLAQKYGIELYVHNNYKNIASDWNFAYSKAETKYVTLAHQDDIYKNKYTELSLKAAEKEANNLITFTGYDEIRNDLVQSNTLLLLIKRALLAPFLFRDSIANKYWKKSLFLFGSSICCPSVMYNKNNLGEFHFCDNLKIALDWDAWLKLSKAHGSLTYVKEQLVSHRIHRLSETSLGIANSLRYYEDKFMLEKIWPKPFAALLLFLFSFVYHLNSIDK